MATKQQQQPQQRRGKNEKSPAASSAEEQIRRAQATVEQSRATAEALHSQWRLHLLRLSYMVVLVTMHQWQGPMTYCLYDMKSYNKSLTPLDDASWRISGLQAIYYVLNDTLTEFLALVMGIMVTLFLNQMHTASAVTLVNANGTTQREGFTTNIFYMISTGLVPPILNFYYTRSKDKATKSCLDHSSVFARDGTWTRHAAEDENLSRAVRGFPVIIIFHVVATVCCWFMEMQIGQQNKNMQMLENLKRELADAQSDNKEGKKKS